MKRCRQLEEVVRASPETFNRERETQRPIQLADSTLVLSFDTVDQSRSVMGFERPESAVT